MNGENTKTLLNGKKIANLDARNQAWEKTRERGPVAYILRDMLIAGVSVCVFEVGFRAYSHHLPLGKMFLNSIGPILWGICGGLIGGIFGWNINENRHQKALTQDFSTNEIPTR